MPGHFPGLRGRHAGIEVVKEAVRRARLEARLSQAQLAEPEFSRTSIYLMEKGKMNPGRRLLRQIAQRTGRPVSYFLPGSEITPEQRETTDALHRLVATADFAEAIVRGEQLLLDGQLPRVIEAEVRFLVGRSYIRTLDGQRGYPHLVRARALYELTGDEAQLADTLNQMACALYLLEDERGLSVAYQSLDVCERLQPAQPELTVRTLLVLGMFYNRLQDWHRAIGHYHRALDQIGSSLGIRNLAMIHDQLSQSYERVGRFADAIHHARKAMKFYHGSLDPTDMLKAEQNLGHTLLRHGELRAARHHLERALVLCDDRDLQRQARAAPLLSLAELHIECEELDLAERRLAEALSLAEQFGERSRVARAHALRGRLHVKRQEYDEADHAFSLAVELFRTLQLPVDLHDVQAEQVESLHAQGRNDDALRLAREALASGRIAATRVQSGWADVVAAHWGRD